MALEQKDIEFIESYLKENLPRILAEQSLAKPPVVYEIELRERMVRVEEELKHQRELMKEGFDQINKRLELLENRFDILSRRLFQFMIWTFGLVVSSTGIIIAFMKMQ
ncbi:MAG: hypothetical protein QHH74_16695 [Spirochaetota bacterium]|nr:hypothetical protein [Spirochaetota bacterium]